jgi:hypothetical protein
MMMPFKGGALTLEALEPPRRPCCALRNAEPRNTNVAASSVVCLIGIILT